jgi:hypothetical protein
VAVARDDVPRRIEELRERLAEAVRRRWCLTGGEALRLSRAIDRLVVEHMRAEEGRRHVRPG